MLSYQHAYHAGNVADLHKHAFLCLVLEEMKRKHHSFQYLETHSGAGLYDLKSKQAQKTGEAEQGALTLQENNAHHFSLPPLFEEILKKYNKGKFGRIYPGSPLIAANILRQRDFLGLCELHPAEFARLEKSMQDYENAHIIHDDGYYALFDLPSIHKGLSYTRPTVIMIDPSYEIKSEYDQMPDFIVRLKKRYTDCMILLWYPKLPAARHVPMIEALGQRFESSKIIHHHIDWQNPNQDHRLSGSGVVQIL
jgi:23S rRNA (adenine2030-N6)-methyltransferase